MRFFKIFPLIFILILLILILWIKPKQLGSDYIHNQYWLIRPLLSIKNIITKKNSIASHANQSLEEKYHKLYTQHTLLKKEFLALSKQNFYQPNTLQLIATAKVISSQNPLFPQLIRINAGKKSHIQKGDIAITQEGIVGQIIHTFDTIADILPLHHVSSKISGKIFQNNEKVFLSGIGNNYAKIEYATNDLTLKEKQKIVTLSDGKSIPENIPLGYIDNIEDLTIKFYVHFNQLNFVQVVRLTQ